MTQAELDFTVATSPFVLAAIHWAEAEENEDVARTLRYLIQCAVGRANAIPLSVIVTYLHSHGSRATRNWVQNRIIVPSRATPAFIGSCENGIYQIATPEDAHAMSQWYRHRMRAEMHHLVNLRGYAKAAGWREQKVEGA